MSKPASSPALQLIGHRGNGVGPDENTVAAYLDGIAQGAGRIEVDVQRIGGKLYAKHPPRAGQPHNPIATPLGDILAATTVPLVLHLKRRRLNPWHDRAALRQLATLELGDAVISSFWPGTLTHLKRYYPQRRSALLTFWLGYDIWFAKRLGVSEIHAWVKSITPAAAARTRRGGLVLVGFGVRSAYGLKPLIPNVSRLLEHGVDGVIIDRIAETARLLRESEGGTLRAADPPTGATQKQS